MTDFFKSLNFDDFNKLTNYIVHVKGHTRENGKRCPVRIYRGF